MGGEHSGVTEATTDIVIECAYFSPEAIGATGRKLGLTSDARSRFERGVDPGFLGDGLALATQMVLDLCGGEPSQAVTASEPPLTDRTVSFDHALTRKLAGVGVETARQREILYLRGVSVAGGAAWQVRGARGRRAV